ncbi:MAG: hypothetical protein N3A64_04130 [Desulfobacterota bacterium]|nr:hypothetical protein [Thermodesulfobacteriota bacterium]
MLSNSTKLSKEEIKSLLIKVHRDNQILWSKWFSQATDPVEKSGLYRYREGFDAAILNLAQQLQLSLATSKPLFDKKGLLDSESKKGDVISLEKISSASDGSILFCSHCQETLFRKKNKCWYCPTCKTNFRFQEE